MKLSNTMRTALGASQVCPEVHASGEYRRATWDALRSRGLVTTGRNGQGVLVYTITDAGRDAHARFTEAAEHAKRETKER